MHNPQRVLLKRVAFTFFCLIFLYPATAYAATYNVGNGDVAGLIAAMNAANSSPAPNTINLASGGTYTLTAVDNGVNGLPAITNSMTINGNGATIQRSSAPEETRLQDLPRTDRRDGDLLRLDHQ